MAKWRVHAYERFGFSRGDYSYPRGFSELLRDLVLMAKEAGEIGDTELLENIADCISWASKQPSAAIQSSVDLIFFLPVLSDPNLFQIFSELVPKELFEEKVELLTQNAVDPILLKISERQIQMPFPVDIKYVSETEQKLGVKFPPSYVVKMVKLNGGSVETPPDSWNLYPIFDTSDKKRLQRTCNDVVRETKSAQDWPDYPVGAVAIGSNGTGDQLVFIPQADAPDLLDHAVYWWDHETGELEKVAEDFGELL